MTLPIGGTLRYDLLAQHHFQTMPEDQQHQAIVRLATAGAGDHTIARATSLSVELVRRVLTEVRHVRKCSPPRETPRFANAHFREINSDRACWPGST